MKLTGYQDIQRNNLKIMTFLNSILKKSKKYEFPFNHWEYNNALNEEAIKEVEGADIPDVTKYNLSYD